MATTLKGMRIREISLVDRGANAGARVLLAKRKFTSAEREAAESKGAAMPGGSFPINNVQDLKNAIHAIGRAKDPAGAKAHIKTRARRLGRTDLLPETWAKRKDADLHLVKMFKAVDFDAAQAAYEANEYSDELIEEIKEAVCSLQEAVSSVMADSDVEDKRAALDDIYQQFQDHIAGVVPEGVEQGLMAAGLVAAGYQVNPQGAINKKDKTMTEDTVKLQKKLASALEEIEALKAESKLAKREVIVAKMGGAHAAYHATLSPKDAIKFAAMSDEERDAKMKASPLEKGLPPHVQELIAKAAANEAVIAELQKRESCASFAKRALDMGLSDSFGEVLAKAYDGDPSAQGDIERTIKGLTAQVKTGGIFKEFGTTQGAPADSATAQMAAVASELRKSNPAYAAKDDGYIFAKIAEMPQHLPLWKRFKDESLSAA